MVVDVWANTLDGLRIKAGGAGGGAGGGDGSGGGGDGGGGVGGGGAGDGSGGIGVPGWYACKESPATRLKCESREGLGDVEWQILYTPATGSVTSTKAKEDTAVAFHTATVAPVLSMPCVAPLHVSSPARRKTI